MNSGNSFIVVDYSLTIARRLTAPAHSAVHFAYSGRVSPHHATAWSPFLATRVRSFREAPCGCFSPRSHWLTSPVVTFRYRAKTAWLAPSRNRRPRISVGFSGRTGVRQSSSNSRIVRLSIPPAPWRPSALSWMDAITGLLYCFLIAHHLRQRSRRNYPSGGRVVIAQQVGCELFEGDEFVLADVVLCRSE